MFLRKYQFMLIFILKWRRRREDLERIQCMILNVEMKFDFAIYFNYTMNGQNPFLQFLREYMRSE